MSLNVLLWPVASAILIVECNVFNPKSSSKNIPSLGTFVSFACKMVDLVLSGQDGEVLCRTEVSNVYLCVCSCYRGFQTQTSQNSLNWYHVFCR